MERRRTQSEVRRQAEMPVVHASGQVRSDEYNRRSLLEPNKETSAMRRTVIVSCLLAAILLVAGCAHRHAGVEATQENFGVNMARMNLWREAMFRFKRAVQINPGDAMAHNNLAVACEANGDFDAAAKEYREAMRLDKSNQYIQKNYSRFVEFTSRNKKRQQKTAARTASTAATTPASTPAASTAAPGTATASSAPAPPAGSPEPAVAAPPAVTPAAQPPATSTAPPAVTSTAPPAATSTAPPAATPPPADPATQPKPPGDLR
jgi:cytochrome c-type biogenesis protein CcmH/NrfG